MAHPLLLAMDILKPQLLMVDKATKMDLDMKISNNIELGNCFSGSI
jgi:hypothetical protein